MLVPLHMPLDAMLAYYCNREYVSTLAHTLHATLEDDPRSGNGETCTCPRCYASKCFQWRLNVSIVSSIAQELPECLWQISKLVPNVIKQ